MILPTPFVHYYFFLLQLILLCHPHFLYWQQILFFNIIFPNDLNVTIYNRCLFAENCIMIHLNCRLYHLTWSYWYFNAKNNDFASVIVGNCVGDVALFGRFVGLYYLDMLCNFNYFMVSIFCFSILVYHWPISRDDSANDCKRNNCIFVDHCDGQSIEIYYKNKFHTQISSISPTSMLYIFNQTYRIKIHSRSCIYLRISKFQPQETIQNIYIYCCWCLLHIKCWYVWMLYRYVYSVVNCL